MTAAAAPLSRGFDPEWPHGHEACIDGEFFPARILCTDLKFNRPVLAAILRDGEETCRAYRTDGTWYEDDRRHENFYLRNAPAPRASGTDWVVRFQYSNGDPSAHSFRTEEEARSQAKTILQNGCVTNIAVCRVDWTEGDGLEPQP